MINTISLIGMPGAGKSTVGVILAKQLGLNFVDTDLVIQVQYGKTLQEILEEKDYLFLRELEEQVLLDCPLEQSLVSTGGSAVYSEPAMRRLASAGPVVFIDVTLNEILNRVKNESQRGIARPPGFSLQQVFNERLPMYQRWANYTVPPTVQTSVEACADDIANWLLQRLG
jgi:shikimate kinase